MLVMFLFLISMISETNHASDLASQLQLKAVVHQNRVIRLIQAAGIRTSFLPPKQLELAFVVKLNKLR